MKIINVENNDAGRRLDRFLRKYLPNASLNNIYKIIRKDIKINGKRKGENYLLEEGDKIFIYIDDTTLFNLMQRDKPGFYNLKQDFKIVYEDENVIFVNKPAGLLTHGNSYEKKNHLANQVKDYLIKKGDYSPLKETIFSPAPANRIDRNTSGLVLFGKNMEALKDLNWLIKNNKVSKFYLSICYGNLYDNIHLVSSLHKNDNKNIVKVVQDIQNGGKRIITDIYPIKSFNGYTLLKINLITGKTHQIRAHLNSINHPIIGDNKYTKNCFLKNNQLLNKKYGLSGQLLHSSQIIFSENDTSLCYLSNKKFIADRPQIFNDILKDLKKREIIQ